MAEYPFQLVDAKRQGAVDPATLLDRPFARIANTFEDGAKRFVPGDALEAAINTAIAVGSPLLITGEPGTGKTQAAYYAAWKLGIEPVIHFQVKSESTSRDLLYHFDTVRYFHDAHLAGQGTLPDKSAYVEQRDLWQAMVSPHPRVLLIDEIDKAPRDFPNDLLHELDQMEFSVPEVRVINDQGQEAALKVQADRNLRPIVFITSNSERRLPEPFLRRCVYHHIRMDDDLVRDAVNKRRDQYARLSDEFVKLAVARFLDLRNRSLRKRPSTAELLVWLRILALAVGTYPEALDRDPSKLPYLGVLLKDHQDIEELGSRG